MSQIEELSASLEDYLEAIYHVVSEKQAARAKDIARKTGVNSSSVTGALRSLAEKGYINYAPYDLITLTAKGQQHARDVVRRHEALKDFFIRVLFIESVEAEETACKMEHTVSRAVLDRIISLMEFIDLCPRAGTEWLQQFAARYDKDASRDECKGCLEQCIGGLRDLGGLDPDSGVTQSLSSLARGERGIIVKITGTGNVARQMKDSGANVGNIIEVEAVDEAGELITAKVMGYHLDLRKEDAEKVVVRMLS
ncbi:metal-dependent transcriptional regulator [Desulfoluna sp.]|uniref:metal-dependent transcriptional regulator n=1 Tax=Desulfoluna sp. TaxID=2045199 RepID=UPI00260EB42A|nr:metal-dependent transcriptional regulator [Desulfoluna sp.]